MPLATKTKGANTAKSQTYRPYRVFGRLSSSSAVLRALVSAMLTSERSALWPRVRILALLMGLAMMLYFARPAPSKNVIDDLKSFEEEMHADFAPEVTAHDVEVQLAADVVEIEKDIASLVMPSPEPSPEPES